MAKLSTGDKFLVNRQIPDGFWKSFKVDYDQLVTDVGGENTIDLPIIGFTEDISELDNTTAGKLRFSASPLDLVSQSGTPMELITSFLFSASQREILKGKTGEEIEVYNQASTETVIYTLTADGAPQTNSNDSPLELKVAWKEGAGTLYPENQVTIRPLTVISGGGSILIGMTPGDMPVEGWEEGTLWFYSDIGILYIWYVNFGDDNKSGQWVDVRPSSAGAGASSSGFSIPSNLSPPEYPKNGDLWVDTNVCPPVLRIYQGCGGVTSWIPVGG